MQAAYGYQCVDVSAVKTLRKAVEEVKSPVRKWFQKFHQFFKGRISKTSAALAEVY